MTGKKTDSAGVKPVESQGKNSQNDEALVADNATAEVVAEQSATIIKSVAEIEARADEKLAALGATAGEATKTKELANDESAEAQTLADTIFEQYPDKNEVYITIDNQAFWLDEMAASQNRNYRKFERK